MLHQTSLSGHAPKAKLHRYGLDWPGYTEPLDVELHMIREGGYVTIGKKRYGEGLFAHHRAAQSLLWPEDDHHRWSDLVLRTMCEERITVVCGPRDSSKTRTLSKWTLVDYWCSPENTLTLMTTTGIRELELRVWGDIKSLFSRAKQRFPNLAGNINQANHGVFTDNLDERGDLRDMRRGCIGVPLISGTGEWVGLEKFVGIKQTRRRLIGDELQFCPIIYINVLDAFDKGDFRGGFLGNPIGGNGKALDKISEPIEGWSSLGEVIKTTTWKNKYGGVTVQLVGTDSPNFDPNRPKDYPYLIDAKDVERVAARNGRDSAQFWTLIQGVRKVGVDQYRILTTEMCEQTGAFNTVTWAGSDRTKVYAIDAGFGGDPCEVVYVEFGDDVTGAQKILFSETYTIAIRVSDSLSAEDQIATYVKAECARLGVPDENIFFDAGMRATLAVSMAKIISPQVNAVNFGGPTTDRPVDEDAFITDPKTGERRLARCSEQYSKFVTEMWYSMRAATTARQVRGLSRKAAEEFHAREWRPVPGPLGMRYELETKAEYKARNAGHSPNRADVCSLALEGARRLGFKISAPLLYGSKPKEDDGWLRKESDRYRRFMDKTELKYA